MTITQGTVDEKFSLDFDSMLFGLRIFKEGVVANSPAEGLMEKTSDKWTDRGTTAVPCPRLTNKQTTGGQGQKFKQCDILTGRSCSD